MIMAIDAMQSPPAGVDDPGDANDETQDDPTDPTGLPADDNNTPHQPFTLSPQMIAAAGLPDLKVGDSFLITVKGTVTDSTDGTVTADIEDAMDGSKAAGDAATPPPTRKPQSRVLSPAEAGFGDEGIPPRM